MQTRKSIVVAVAAAVFMAGVGGVGNNEALALDGCLPCVQLVKTGPTTAIPGETIRYDYTVINCGNVLVGSGAYVSDTLFHPSDPIWAGEIGVGQTVNFEKYYTVPLDICGAIEKTATAIGFGDVGACLNGEFDNFSVATTLTINCPSPNPGTGTPGYWKRHPEAWPVPTITIGTTSYSKDEAIKLILNAEKGDKTFTMFRSLVAAKLNTIIGNDDSCIASTIASANEWMQTYGLGTDIRANTEAWTVGEPLYLLLDAYNNGESCAPPRQ